MTYRLPTISRRGLLAGTAGLAASTALPMPFYARAANRPAFTHGVQSGDVDSTSGMIWTRVDRPSRIQVEYSTVESFKNAVKLPPMTRFDIGQLTKARSRSTSVTSSAPPLHRRR